MYSNVQLNYDEIVEKIKKQIEELKAEILANDNYVPTYSKTTEYKIGDHTWYGNNFYTCITPTSGNFDPEDWMEDDSTSYNTFYSIISPLIKDLNFYVSLEQAFLKSTEKIDPNGVYVAIRFSRASINFGSSMCNVYLAILGTANKVKPTQLFFSAYASRYTNETILGNNTQQIWVTPNVQTNFNEFGQEFRNLYDVSGTLIIGNRTINVLNGVIIYKYGESAGDLEEIPFMAFQDNFRNNLAPQPFGNTHGFAKSETNFSSYSFTISTYLLDTQLAADCMHAKGFELASATGSAGQKKSNKLPNDDFELYIEFSNGYSNKNTYRYIEDNQEKTDSTFFKIFKLVDCGMTNNYGEIPMFTVSFTR